MGLIFVVKRLFVTGELFFSGLLGLQGLLGIAGQGSYWLGCSQDYVGRIAVTADTPRVTLERSN